MKRRDLIITLYRIAIHRRKLANRQDRDPYAKAFSDGFIHAHESIADQMTVMYGFSQHKLKRAALAQMRERKHKEVKDGSRHQTA